jgi:hypothetical protein
MRILGICVLVFGLFACAFESLAAAGNKQVTIKGTSGDGDPYTLTLTIANNKWTESEPAGASKVFTTKTGVWERAVNIVSLNKSDNKTKVGHLNGIVPESVASGATGDGGADETPTTLNWTVQ